MSITFKLMFVIGCFALDPLFPQKTLICFP